MFYLLVRFVLRPLFWVTCRPTVTGRENVPLTGPVMLASNHLSFIDSIAIPLVAPRRVGYLAKAEYWQGRGVSGRLQRALFTALGALPVERGTHRAAQAALDTALGVLRSGGAFGIYPEAPARATAGWPGARPASPGSRSPPTARSSRWR